jgi:hypothetical protein
MRHPLLWAQECSGGHPSLKGIMNSTQINIGNVVSGSASLPSGVNSTYFYMRWVGYLIPVITGEYTIGVNCADGCNLYIGSQALVANLSASGSANSSLAYTQSGTIMLTAGVYYPITVEWQHGGGANYQMQLAWTAPKGSIALIPTANLTSSSTSQNGYLAGNAWNGTLLMWYPTGAGTLPYGFTGVWSSTVGYVAGDEVTYSGSYWKCVTANTNSAPTLTNANWQNVGASVVGLAAYNGSTAYFVNNQVTYGGNVYTCILATTGNLPTNATYWTLIGPATLDDVADGTTYQRVLATALTSGAINPSLSGFLMKGNVPPVLAVPFSYTSTSTSITWNWAANSAIYRADGTVTQIGAGSQTITGLEPSTTYNFYPIYDEATATLRFITTTDVTTPYLIGVTLNGTTGYISTTTSLSQPGSFSVELWAVLSGSGEQPLLSLQSPQLTGSAADQSLVLYAPAGDVEAVLYLSTGTVGISSSPLSYDDGQVHHIVLTWNNSTFALVLYVDGVQVATATASYALKSQTGMYWHVGYMYNPTNLYADGAWISNVAIYNSVLSATQVATDFSAGSNLGQTALAAAVTSNSPSYYWKLQETSGTSAADSAGSNTGTYQGSYTLNGSEATHGAVGSPAIAWVSNTYLANQAQILQGNIALSTGTMQVTTPASGSGTPGTGGGRATGTKQPL